MLAASMRAGSAVAGAFLSPDAATGGAPRAPRPSTVRRSKQRNYQTPDSGQPPLPFGSHVLLTSPSALRRILNVSPEVFDSDATSYSVAAAFGTDGMLTEW